MIIGNGIAGLHAAEIIKQEVPSDSIVEIYTDEKYLTYSRPKLPQYISQEIKHEELFLKSKAWFDNKKISMNL
ncbi:MAG: NAD(P)/FAD-dependent oxidoreductase, partial [Candidatus Helarchaeota archaeon]